jgi:hypothetical protein
MIVERGNGRSAMDALIDFVLGNLAGVFCILLGIGLIIYSSFVKRISFEGDVAVRPEERKLYEATSRMRKYGIALGLLPLLYGLYLLLYPGS